MRKEPAEPRQVAAAKLVIAWADLMVSVAHSLPRWMRWYRIRLVARSWEHREGAFKILADWEMEKLASEFGWDMEKLAAEIEQFHERNDRNG